MKKLLIGCGVIALLLVGGVSFVAWKLWPAVTEFYGAMDSFVVDMQTLNEEYPYDPEQRVEFDVERFAEALELRGGVRRQVAGLHEHIRALSDDEDVGILATVASSYRSLGEAFAAVALLLEEARMSPTEFSHHMTTYWSAARSAHDGLGDQARLAGLREQYENLAEIHERARDESPELPRLTKLLEPVSPAQTEGARAYLEQHRDLVEFEDLDLVVEMLLLQLSNPNTELVQQFGTVIASNAPREEQLPVPPTAPPQEAAEDR